MLSKTLITEPQERALQGGLSAWIVCLSAGLFFFYEFFQLNIFDVINVSLRDEFKLSAAQLSWMSSTFLWADIIFLLPAGILLDYFSTKKIILISMLSCVLGTVGFALSTHFTLACIFHFMTGIGNAFCFLACVVLVSRWFPMKRQAFVIGVLVTMAFIGGMIAHTPFAYLTQTYGWREALLLDGFVGILFLIWLGYILEDTPRHTTLQTHQKHHKPLTGFWHVLTNAQNWYAGIYTALLNLPIMVLCALWGASYLKTVHHFSDIAASNIVSCIYLGSIIGCPLAGFLSDSHGVRKSYMIAGAVTSMTIVLPLILQTTFNQAELSLLFFALGFFTSTQVLAYPLVAESNPLASTGTAIGIASVIIMGGGALGQLAFGCLLEAHADVLSSHVHRADFQFAMWLFPVACIIALLISILLRETFCSRNYAERKLTPEHVDSI